MKVKFSVLPEWKDVYLDGSISDYQVSNTGMVKNKKTGKTLSSSRNDLGYWKIGLYHNNKIYYMKIHRLVAIAYIPNPENKRTVNHKDGSKDNNEDWNLEWATHKENIHHAIETGLMSNWGKGSDKPNSRYTEDQAHHVCQLLEDGYSNGDISEIVKVPQGFVKRIKSGKKWTHISDQYDIPKPLPRNHRSMEFTIGVMELICAGFNNAEIRQICDMSDTLSVRDYLNRLRRGDSKKFNDYLKNHLLVETQVEYGEVGVGPQANGGDESLKSKREVI